MPHDPELADRLRRRLAAEQGITERAMFGGIGFMAAGNMAVAAGSDGTLVVRADPADPTVATRPGAAPMEMRGRPMAGWLRVDRAAVSDDGAFEQWVATGLAAARALPPKG